MLKCICIFILNSDIISSGEITSSRTSQFQPITSWHPAVNQSLCLATRIRPHVLSRLLTRFSRKCVLTRRSETLRRLFQWDVYAITPKCVFSSPILVPAEFACLRWGFNTCVIILILAYLKDSPSPCD